MTMKVLLVFTVCLMAVMASSSTSFLRKQTALTPDDNANDLAVQNNTQALAQNNTENTENTEGNEQEEGSEYDGIEEAEGSENSTLAANNSTEQMANNTEETSEPRALDAENTETSGANNTNSTEQLIATPENGENSGDSFLGNTPIISIDDLIAQQNGTNATNATNVTNNTAEETSEQRGLDNENTENSAGNNTNSTEQLIPVPESSATSGDNFLGNTPIISIDDLIAQQNGTNGTNATNATNATNNTAEETSEGLDNENTENSAANNTNSTEQLTPVPKSSATSGDNFLGNTPIISINDLIAQQNTTNTTNNTAEESSEQSHQRALDDTMPNSTEANNTETETEGEAPMTGDANPMGEEEESSEAGGEESNEEGQEESSEKAEENSESSEQLLNTAETSNDNSTSFLGNTPIISINDLMNQNSTQEASEN